jgi:hypothetical protein
MSIAIKRSFTIPSTSAIGASELYLTSSLAATSIGSGAFQVVGGAGIGGSLWTSSSYFSSISGVGLSAGTITGRLSGTATSAQVLNTITDNSSTLYILGTRSNGGFAGTSVYVTTGISALGNTITATTFSGTATTATSAGSAGTAINAGFAGAATTATNSGTAGTSVTSGSSGSATTATSAGSAGTSVSAGTAGTATNAGSAGTSVTAGSATTSTSAGSAGTAVNAGNAGSATTATSAGTAGTATNAGSAGTSVSAGTAATATNAGSAGTSVTAGSAGTAVNAGSATTATNAGFAGAATTAISAGTAGTSTNAGSAGTSVNAGSATTATSAGTAGTAANAGSAGTSVTSGSSGSATTATSAGTAGTATNAANTNIVLDTTSTIYLTGSRSNASIGSTPIYLLSGVSALGNTITATTFTGALSGTASSSALVNIDASTSTRYLLGTILNTASGSTQVSVGSGITIGNNLLTSGAIVVTNSTVSSSTTSGALVVTGGVGIGGTLNIGVDLFISGLTSLTFTSEKLNTKTSATGTVTHDLSTGSIFYHSSISNNFTANFTNVPTTNDRAIGVTLVLAQGVTPYMSTALQIDGSAQTIKWVNNSTPTGTANKVDIVGFSLIRTGSAWTVLAQYSTYG